MKLRLMPLVASLCGIFFCASVAQANSVFIHNKPVANVVTINNTVYVPFADLMKGLHHSWIIDEKGNVCIKRGGDCQALVAPSFNLVDHQKNVKVDGVVRNGQVWVPVRIARDLGYELSYNPLSEIVDIISPRLLTDADRQAQAEVDAARAERNAALAEQKAAEKSALEERKQAMAELKAKRAKASAGEDTAKAGEGTYDPNFEAEQLAAAKKVEATQKDFGPVETYSDLMRVQQQLDEQDAARRAARRAAQKAETGDDDEEAAAPPPPTPNLVVFAPRATPDYFTGHITLTATVKNIGTDIAKGCSAALSLVAPDGSVIYTQRLNNASVDVNGQWAINIGYDHIAGSSMPHGAYQLRVAVDCTNKAVKK